LMILEKSWIDNIRNMIFFSEILYR